MRLFVLGLLLALCTLCTAEVGKLCTHQSECATDECCQIINIVILSRKRQLVSPFRPLTNGTCEKYKLEGESCAIFDVLNGYCGCAEGLSCKSVVVSALDPAYSLRKINPSTCSLN